MTDPCAMEEIARRLLQVDFEAAIPDAPTVIERADVVSAESGVPQHLEVWGWTAPQIHFVMKLPILAAWNRRSLFIGSGGPGGVANPAVTERGVQLGFATATTDTGHSATGIGSIWSWGNRQAFDNWAWRGVHVASVAIHEIIRAAYDAEIEYRYYAGTSTGGRHALAEAQRFPGDFDGILANNSGHNYMYATYTWPWLAQEMFESDGTPILAVEDMPIITESVLAQSVAAGAVEDGIIVRPWEVTVDADAIPLPERKRQALRHAYTGPEEQPAARGFRGLMPGSEAHGDWEFLFAGSRHLFSIAQGLVRYQIYDAPPGPTASIADWSPEHWPHAFTTTSEDCSAVDPDLDEFRARGGKLLMTQSWGDAWVDPHHALWYQHDLTSRYGHDSSDVFRLFMIPGRGHLSGFHHYGPTADTLDLLVRWVEQDLPPETLEVDGRPIDASIGRPEGRGA